MALAATVLEISAVNHVSATYAFLKYGSAHGYQSMEFLRFRWLGANGLGGLLHFELKSERTFHKSNNAPKLSTSECLQIEAK